MADSAIQLLYVTCANEQEARTIAGALLEKQLIACANLLPPITSIYRWEGKLETSQEVVLLLKTRSALFGAVEREVMAMHSYECPCLIALDVTHAHAAFLQWVREQTAN